MPQMHEVEFEIHGSDMQFIEVILDPGEAAVLQGPGQVVHVGDAAALAVPVHRAVDDHPGLLRRPPPRGPTRSLAADGHADRP